MLARGLQAYFYLNSHMCVAHPHSMCVNLCARECVAERGAVAPQAATLGTTFWAPTGRPSCASARPSS